APDDRLMRRTVGFGVAVALLGLVAGWFILTTFRGNQQGKVSLSAQVIHTVEVLKLPGSQRDRARSMLNHTALQDLSNGHELHLREVNDGKVAICAGSFDSGESPEVKRLLRRFQQFTREGKRPFADARVMKLSEHTEN
ncbi:MAG: hypothetical protein ACOC2T_04165, partial [Planctomycetota bacterium]